jgi:hypothetical protein
MSCAARYSETTSLEFILNPFKFFFTNYVAKIAPYSPPNTPHLETKFRPPTILHSYRSDCVHRRCPCTAALPPHQHSTAVLLNAPLPVSRHTLLREPLRSSNDPTAVPDGMSAHAHFVAESADVCTLYVSGHLFPQRATHAFGLHQHMPVTCSSVTHARFHT